MDTNLLRQFGQVFTKQRTNLNVRLAIFSFFLVVATILWYLNKLSYEYSTVITYPLKLENMPKGKVIVGDPPKKIDLKVKAHGYSLLRYKLTSKLTPIRIDLNQLPLESSDDSENNLYLLTTRVKDVVSSQLKGELQLENIVLDRISLEFAPLAEKKVRVIPNLSYSFERQHTLAGPIRISPDSIVISGPKSIIDTIKHVSTQIISFGKLNDNTTISASIQSVNQVGFSHRKVIVTIPVERFTEAVFSKYIEVKNLPDTVKLILLPRVVEIKCNVILSKYRTVSEEHVRAVVDYSTIDVISTNKLRVQIIQPKYIVSNVDFNPKFVDFIIEYL